MADMVILHPLRKLFLNSSDICYTDTFNPYKSIQIDLKVMDKIIFRIFVISKALEGL